MLGVFALGGNPLGTGSTAQASGLGAAAVANATATANVRKTIFPAAATLAVASVTAATNPAPVVTYPVRDASNSGWTPSTAALLYSLLDETSPSDADFISAASGATCELNLQTSAYPGGAGRAIQFRASSTLGSSLIVNLRQGVSVIASFTQVLTPTITTYTKTLTAPQVAALTSGQASIELVASA